MTVRSKLAIIHVDVFSTDGRNPRANLAENSIYRCQRLAGAYALDQSIPPSLAGYLYIAASQVHRLTPDSEYVIAEVALGIARDKLALPFAIPGQHVTINVSKEFRNANLAHHEFTHGIRGQWLCHNEETGGEVCYLWDVASTRSIQTFRRTAIQTLPCETPTPDVTDTPEVTSTRQTPALTWSPPTATTSGEDAGENDNEEVESDAGDMNDEESDGGDVNVDAPFSTA